jgi:hypothetical protein
MSQGCGRILPRLDVVSCVPEADYGINHFIFSLEVYSIAPDWLIQ